MNDPSVTGPVAVALGIIVPLLVSLLKARHWPTEVNQAISILVSFGAGFGVFAIDQHGVSGFSWPLVFGYAGAVFALANTFYRVYFGGTTLNAALEGLLWKQPPAASPGADTQTTGGWVPPEGTPSAPPGP